MFSNSDYEAYTKNGLKNPVNEEYHHIFIHKIIEKLNQGKDVNVVMCGAKGNGKSMGALKLVEILYNDLDVFKGQFDAQTNLIYDTLDYLDIMRNIELPEYDSRDDNINPEREAIIIDESGVQLNKSDYNSEMNDAIADMLQVQRKANCLVIYCLPIAGDLDVRIKKDIDFVVEFIDVGVAKVTGYTFQHGRLDKDSRLFINFNRQELLTNPQLSLLDDNGFWKPSMPKDKDNLKVYSEKENDYKQGVPEELFQKIKKKRREKENKESGSAFDEILNDM